MVLQNPDTLIGEYRAGERDGDTPSSLVVVISRTPMVWCVGVAALVAESSRAVVVA